MKPKYVTKIDALKQIPAEEREQLEKVSEKFVFRTNDYYNSLIDWDDPADPIRRLVIPDVAELDEWGALDASGEHNYTRVPGLEHKYTDTALLLVNDVCGAYCRFCFRKRLFMNDNDEVHKDISEGVKYISEHPEINNVLLTGGDPLVMNTRRLRDIFSTLRQIDHVQIIRIGTKMPAFNPYRVLNDESLLEAISEFSTDYKKIYVMAHFNHPRELTDVAVKGLNALLKAGAIIINQTPLIAGVNDNPEVIQELFNKLSYIGIPPYYLFQCRPTEGNRTYSIPIERSLAIFEQARMGVSGLAKRARLSMSHVTGKIEILGMNDEHIFFRYQRAANPANDGKLMMYRRVPEACWFDDYSEDDLVQEFGYRHLPVEAMAFN